MSFSFLPKIHQILSGIFVGPKNSRDVQTNMILSLLHLLKTSTQILRPTYSIIHREYIVWTKKMSKIRIHINPAFPYNVSIFLDLP